MAEHGEIFWNECNVRPENADQAKAFYADLMGWEMIDGPMPSGEGRYILAKRGEEMVAGMFPMEGPDFENIPPHWFTYLTVANLDEAVSKVSALGGSVLKEPFEIPQVARFAIIRDVAGAVVGLAEPT